MNIDLETIRAFRLLLRDFFDAQFDDWGEEANEPRLAVIEQFVANHSDVHAELVELFRFTFLDLRDGVCPILERLGTQFGVEALTQEIDEFAERRPREVRTGYVRRMREALIRSIERVE